MDTSQNKERKSGTKSLRTMGTFIELTGEANDTSPKDPKMTNPLNLEEFEIKNNYKNIDGNVENIDGWVPVTVIDISQNSTIVLMPITLEVSKHRCIETSMFSMFFTQNIDVSSMF